MNNLFHWFFSLPDYQSIPLVLLYGCIVVFTSILIWEAPRWIRKYFQSDPQREELVKAIREMEGRELSEVEYRELKKLKACLGMYDRSTMLR